VNKRAFDYGLFFNELKNDPRKREIAIRYENVFGSQKNLTIEDQPFFQNYLSQFSIPFKIVISNDCPDDFDWELMIRYILGSVSTDYKLILDEDWKNHPKGTPTVHIAICVSTAEKNECKMLDELFDLQVLEIFKAYTYEQIKLSLVIKEESDEYKDNELSMKDGLENQLLVYKCREFMMHKEIQSIRNKKNTSIKK